MLSDEKKVSLSHNFKGKIYVIHDMTVGDTKRYLKAKAEFKQNPNQDSFQNMVDILKRANYLTRIQIQATLSGYSV